MKSINKLCYILGFKKAYVLDLVRRVDSCYESYIHKTIKKNGNVKIRQIDSPNFELKKVQKRINNRILRPLVGGLPDYVNGSRRGRSVATALGPHIGKEVILSLDISDCFPSISSKRVFYAYKTLVGCSDETARILTMLTTKDGVLPQGCSTSASLCNLVLLPLLKDLDALSKNYNVTFTQYMDDLFFSGRHEDVINLIDPALRTIGKRGFNPNKHKIYVGFNSGSMQAMGTTINCKLSVGRKTIRRIEREIMSITPKDASDWNQLAEERKKNPKFPSCGIERIRGKILSVKTINEQQARHLEKRLTQQLGKLKV